MNQFKRLKNLFAHGEKQKEPSLTDQLWVQGHNAFCLGKDCYDKRKIEEAIRCFDIALECGYDDDADLFFMRGWCLQNMGYDLDAIDDFSKAIELEPKDSNNYFLRSISKGSAGDHFGRIKDLKEAIRSAEMYPEPNRGYNMYAQEQGYLNVSQHFQAYLDMALIDLEFFKKAFDPNSPVAAEVKELNEKRSNKKRRSNVRKNI